ncbi:MAG: DNA mismatch repair protein MutS [Desulfovibrionaceae bacterium]|nr:DNA mismatch repair protein MutS [Desulfovibrionaceae bacterium]
MDNIFDSGQSTDSVRLTPMLDHYLGIKKEHPDALLFYRMGDFFELFFEDARIAARELQLALTSRNPNAPSPVPMAGVPHHALEPYLPQLLEKGYKLVICDQVENPKEAKGLVKREVTRILTPGTVVDEAALGKEHNYLGALYWDENKGAGGFAWVDNSTGSWSGLQSGKESDLWQWVRKLSPKELLLPENSGGKQRFAGSADLEGVLVIHAPIASHFSFKSASSRVLKAQGVQELHSLGLEDKMELTVACGALLAYLQQTQRDDIRHLSSFVPFNPGRYLILDEITERNLELFRRLDGKKGPGTLFQSLDETVTPMGSRLLEERLGRPWRDLAPILETQAVVEYFYNIPEKLTILRNTLKDALDLERLSTRISLGRALPRDFSAMRQTLGVLPQLATLLRRPILEKGQYPTSEQEKGEDLPPALRRLLKNWDNLEDLHILLLSALAEIMPPQVTEGGLFRPGYNAQLDEFMDLAEHGEKRLQELLAKEQSAAGLPRLKLGYNRVFGYYFELSRAMADKAPTHFIRRQTLAGTERYATEEMKELEEKLLSATEQRNNLEYGLFQELRGIIASARARFVFMGAQLAVLDYWQALAVCARKQAWRKPSLHEGLEIHIRQGRHPVVEEIQGKGRFIPNDLHMDERRRLILITGPNMSGKSTVLRQTAVILLLAQMGSFVPAEEAVLGLADRIFSRVGASDNLAQGQSTFMVEMMETARILRQTSRRSLVILDEIGRGTSTHDGLALAWAVLEDLVSRASSSVRTLFATHYHELTGLEGQLPGVHNMTVAISEHNGELVFLRRLVPGPSDRSYGIEVAKLAGVPQPVVQRARQILTQLNRKPGSLPQERLRSSLLPEQTLPSPDPEPEKNVLDHPLFIVLRDLDINCVSPKQALDLLHDWKTLWGKKT